VFCYYPDLQDPSINLGFEAHALIIPIRDLSTGLGKNLFDVAPLHLALLHPLLCVVRVNGRYCKPGPG
jgi:hypothetical protein